MSPKIKSLPAGEKTPLINVKPPVLHDVTNQTAPAKAASRRPSIATQPASGTANHARHHVSRHTQS
jgi:hypothetical protein